VSVFGLLGLADGWARTVLPLTVAVCAVVYLLYRSGQRIKGKGRITDDSARRQAAGKLSDHAEIRSNLERLLVELQDLARQINAHIDTRFCKLDVLIRQADERIKRLESLTGTGSVDDSGGSSVEGSPEPQQVDPQKAVIYKLADSGKSAAEIARQVNQHPGEVELILSLRRTGQGGQKIDYRIDD